MLDTVDFWQFKNYTAPKVALYKPYQGLKMTPATYIIKDFLYKMVYDLEKGEIF